MLLLLWPQLHAHMQAADSATQTTDSLQRKVQQLWKRIWRGNGSRNRNRFNVIFWCYFPTRFSCCRRH